MRALIRLLVLAVVVAAAGAVAVRSLATKASTSAVSVLARPSRCSGRPTTIAASPSDSAASWSAVRKTSASGGCAVMTP